MHTEGLTFSRENLRRIVEDLGYEFVGVELKKESGASFVRIYIDTLGGVSVRDCEIVSREINRTLDARGEDLLDGRYYMEVSSPGLERPLCSWEDFFRFLGRTAVVKFRESFQGHRRITGRIVAAEEGLVRIENDEGELEIPWDVVSSARLKYVFDVQKKPKTRRKKRKKQRNGQEEEG
ncbi:MAG: hypothetical protein CSA35_03055 [Dethiosulfovibrio peptidovorans]|nr:MAG: hypothetical protein CSA35_03055 [Dethiosulfovibrio peptidovorans]